MSSADPPTEKQINLLNQRKVPVPATKAEASVLIGRLLEPDKPSEERPVTPGNKAQAITLECRIANLKAFIELVQASKIAPECWPACAGVWNATK